MELVVITRLQALEDSINERRQLARKNIVGIGNDLKEAKDILGHGNFMSWVEEKFRWSLDTAQNFMNIAKTTDKFGNFPNLDVPLSALYLLASPSTPDEAIESVAERTESGEKLSVDDVKEEIEAAKPKRTNKIKPRDNQAETDIIDFKNKNGRWPTKKEGTELTGLFARNFDNALRAAKAFEAGQNSHEKMVSIHVLIEELVPLFEEVKDQSKRHVGLISTGALLHVASEGLRLITEWASDDPTVRRVRGRVAVPISRRKKKGADNGSALSAD